MVTKCGICGKGAVFGTMLKCESCGQYFCHRHDREQFSANTITGSGEAPVGPYTAINYPTGEAVKGHFKCYKCRIGKEPQDMGECRDPLVQLYAVASLIILVGLSITTFFGAMAGLTGEMVDAMIIYSLMYFVICVLIGSCMILHDYMTGKVTILR